MIKPITTLAALYLLAMCATSCESDADFFVEDGHTKIFALSEINPYDKIRVFVTTAVGTNTDDTYLYPKQSDVQVTLLEDGIPLDNPGFRYISRENAFVSQGSFRPSPGVQYGLQVEFKDPNSDIPSIYGETIIPVKDSITEASFSKIAQDFILADLSLENLIGKYFTLQIKGDEAFLIRDLLVDRDGFHVVDEGKTLLINKNIASARLSYELFAEETNVAEEVSVELKSITADAFNYYKAFSGQLDEHNHLMYEPVIDRSNFDNGIGLFTGFNVSTSHFIVK